jgi:BED zinc finger
MANFHDNYPNTDSFGHPTGAMATFGEVAGEVAGEAVANTNTDRVPARLRSGIWAHYDRMPDYARTKLVKCRHCGKLYVSSNGSTGNMWRHIKNVHPSMITAQQLDAALQCVAYTHEAFRELLVKWIVARDQPFSEVDAPEFREMVALLNPDANVPSAATIRRDIGRCFDEEKTRIRAMLQDAPGRLSFAIDAWTSPSMLAFLGTTVHWIDADWRLRNLLLAMPSLSGRHTGENLCTTFKAVCHDFGVMTKLLSRMRL